MHVLCSLLSPSLCLTEDLTSHARTQTPTTLIIFKTSRLSVFSLIPTQTPNIIKLPKLWLHWSEKPFICRLNLRFPNPNRRVFSMDVMGHLAIHSFSSHATYWGSQRLVALMWNGEIIKTLHIIKIQMKENTDPLLYQAKLTAVILRMFCFINYFCIKVFSCAIHYFVFYFCYLSFLPPSSLLLLPSFFSSFLIISLSFLKQTNENIKTKQKKIPPPQKSRFHLPIHWR